MIDASFWVLISFIILVTLLYPHIKAITLTYLDSTIEIHKTTIQDASIFSKQSVELLGRSQSKRNEADMDAEKIVTHAKNEAKRIEKLVYQQRGTLMTHAQTLVQKRYELGLKEIENQLYRNISIEAFKKIASKK